MKTFYILLAYTLYIEIMAFIHARRILAGVNPFKWGKAGNIWFKFWMSVFTAFLLSIWKHNGSVPYPAGMLEVAGEMIFLLGWLWLVFDLSLNLMRGLSWNYISDSNGKALDTWFAGRWQLQYINKAASLLIGILVILLAGCG